jgi:4-hydroxy-3-methylbut-2-enyl diphosphate reductase
MLASETQEITEYLRSVMIEKYGSENIKNHIADTRDTLCYATNDNQSATIELLNYDADLAIVVGGYNSSNTSHLVELLEQKFPTYFIKGKDEIISDSEIESFNIHTKSFERHSNFLPTKENLKIIITSGASCPDSIVDGVIQKLLGYFELENSIETILENI